MTFRCLTNELLCREIFEVHNKNDEQNTSDVTKMIEVQSETRSVVDDTNDVTQDILLDSNTNSLSGSSFQESEAETIPAEAETDLSQIEVSVKKGKNATI